MKTAKQTPWFNGAAEVPGAVGVYRVLVSVSACMYAYWDGATWRARSFTPKEAYARRWYRNAYQNPQWCGLITNPKEK